MIDAEEQGEGKKDDFCVEHSDPGCHGGPSAGLGDLLRSAVYPPQQGCDRGVGFVGHVKCEACGAEYDVSAADFTKASLPDREA